MDSSILKKTSELLGEKSRHRRWRITVTALAAIVIITTAYILSKPAHTLAKDAYCGIEEHTHTEECYAKVLICGYEDIQVLPSDVEESTSQETDSEVHQHDESCYIEEKVLICDQEESMGHVHTDACKSVVESLELTCGQEESEGHTHTDACYTVTEVRELTCGQEEDADHSHTDDCYTVEQIEELTCGQEESAGHTHTDDCYTVNQTEELVCGQEESTGHTHTDDCYETVLKLVCGKEETEPVEPDSQTQAEDDIEGAGHVHTEECYAEVLICQAEEHTHTDQCYQEVFCGITGHTHGVDCYDEEGKLICEIAEHKHEANCYKEPHCGITVHIHDKDCYDTEGNLICEMEEHIHTDECYITNNYFCIDWVHTHSNDCYDLEGNLICGSADYQLHTHSESCYDKNGRLICPLAEIVEEEVHTHTEECYGVRGVLICGQTEVIRHEHDDTCRIESSGTWIDTISAVAYCGIPAHTHNDSCKDSEGNLICGREEHIHTEECFEEPGYGCIAQIHVHDADCYDADGNIQCGMADYVIHTHNEMCYGIDGKLLCTLPEIAPHIHGPECYSQESENGEQVLICTLPEVHEHTDACRDENGNLICGKLQIVEHEHTQDCIIDADEIEITQTYKGEDFIVTATYNQKAAALPKEARLFAEKIPEEGNEAHYAERAAQYQQMQGEDEENTMQALMRIGFVSEGVEVEPAAPVTIRIQLLDENGMAEGSSVTVIHFGKDGNERLDGSNAEKNSTTFRMNSFSEIALGWKTPVKTVTVDKTFTYQDDAFIVKFHMEGEAALPTGEELVEAKKENAVPAEEGIGSGMEEAEADQSGDIASGDAMEDQVEDTAAVEDDLDFKVETLDEKSEEYAAVMAYAEETETEEGMLSLQVFSYALIYEGIKLDLTDCVVTAEVMPTKALVDYAEEPVQVMTIGAEDDLEDGIVSETEGIEIENEVVLMAISFTAEAEEIQVEEVLDTMEVCAETQGNSILVTLASNGTDGVFAVRASGQANPKFTVQYYANLDVLNTTGTNALPVIDTSGKKLPVNGKGTGSSPNGNDIKNIYVDDNGKVLTTNTLTEVYSSRPYEYIKAPTIKYFNALLNKPGYELKEVWVLKAGCEDSSTDRTDWDIYTYNEDLHFTNRSVSAEGNSKYILISDGTTIRLVYDTTSGKPDFKAAFYDYDISSGRMYTDVNNAQKNAGTGITQTGNQKDGTLYYAYTKEAGINSAENYSGSGTKLAFGNVNTGTTMGVNCWNDNLLNKYNGTQSGYPAVAGTYQGCTFGLVTELKDGVIQYADGISAPRLFNEGGAIGKTIYDQNQYSLKFIRNGDTYTLTAVNGTTISGLESFNHPSPYEGKVYTTIWTNNFWPMDSAASYGTDGHDLKFGSHVYRDNRAFAGSMTSSEPGSTSSSKRVFPDSDDGKDHNSYFGMRYEVEFELSDEYVGPLEYYFFGDDDMWVFLDGALVCDIGGVHSSVGEYVNLWDYLEKGSEGKHTLSFFYTERGASGSTCWMQFTLPSATTLEPPKEDYGRLRVEKTVTQINNGVESIVDNKDEFTFEIHFTDAAGNKLPDDYSYRKYDRDGNEIGADLIIWDGGEFTLKNGEYIVVEYLPEGTKYRVIEANKAITVTDNISEESKVEYFTDITVDGKSEDDKKNLFDEKVATGSISKGNESTVEYNNKLYIYTLPEAGGPGTRTLYALAGAFGILTGAGLVYRKRFRERRV